MPIDVAALSDKHIDKGFVGAERFLNNTTSKYLVMDTMENPKDMLENTKWVWFKRVVNLLQNRTDLNREEKQARGLSAEIQQELFPGCSFSSCHSHFD